LNLKDDENTQLRSKKDVIVKIIKRSKKVQDAKIIFNR
jgi:hypothetical protein